MHPQFSTGCLGKSCKRRDRRSVSVLLFPHSKELETKEQWVFSWFSDVFFLDNEYPPESYQMRHTGCGLGSARVGVSSDFNVALHRAEPSGATGEPSVGSI